LTVEDHPFSSPVYTCTLDLVLALVAPVYVYHRGLQMK